MLQIHYLNTQQLFHYNINDKIKSHTSAKIKNVTINVSGVNVPARLLQQ